MNKIWKEYELCDMTACYIVDEEDRVGLQLYPTSLPLPVSLNKIAALDSMVQVKLTGDIYNGAYAWKYSA